MTIGSISNGESGSSVRTKLNSVITSVNATGGLIGNYDLSASGQTLDSGNEIDIDVSGLTMVWGSVTGNTFGSADGVGCRVSINSGSSYYSGATDYRYWQTASTAGNITELLVGGYGTSDMIGTFRIYGLNQSGTRVVSDAFTSVSGSGKVYNTQVSVTTSAVDNLRFFARGGNAATAGTLTIWGM